MSTAALSTDSPRADSPRADSRGPDSLGPDSPVADSPTAEPRRAHAPLSVRRLESPVGRIELTANEHGITSLVIERAGVLPHDGQNASTSALLDTAARQLDEYFDGRRRSFDLPVSVGGTAFQRAVWAELERVGWGETTSYGAIGRATGRPAAGRAVGGAVGANPVPIIVGCHRVLATGGRITGYSCGEGIPTKVWLLDHEQIPHA